MLIDHMIDHQSHKNNTDKNNYNSNKADIFRHKASILVIKTSYFLGETCCCTHVIGENQRYKTLKIKQFLLEWKKSHS